MTDELKPAFIEDDPQPPAEEIARLKVELARKLDAAEAEIRSHRSMEPESAMTDELKPRPERGCEHGLALHRARLPTGGWNGPVSYCKCCQSYFGYIDSMSIGTGVIRVIE